MSHQRYPTQSPSQHMFDLSYANNDMIKRNESDVSDDVFEILAKTVFKFCCFILFLAIDKSYITL